MKQKSYFYNKNEQSSTVIQNRYNNYKFKCMMYVREKEIIIIQNVFIQTFDDSLCEFGIGVLLCSYFNLIPF